MSNKNDIVIKTQNGLTISGFESEAQALRVIKIVYKDIPLHGYSSITGVVSENQEEKEEKKKLKCGRAATHMKWTIEEKQFLDDNSELGPSALSRVPFLRERHTKQAIMMRFYTQRAENKKKQNTEVEA